ncbi:histidine kinase [uncultured Draconibacterium sp.]|uniref:sensor histidine kinase n=1 Tax=uncultured Draconibacterium sp. TaxID=1573823 RepID=UPI0029C7B663|nr:histidine kinase [uncultured Draconibacterium sp.]
MKTKLKEIIANPYIQSAMIGALVVLLVYFVWDTPITKFDIELNEMSRSTSDDVLWFIDDFDGDGNSERIRCFCGYNADFLDIVNYDHNGNLIEHHHYPGYNWNFRLTPKIFDVNMDGVKELLYFDERNDSIFFNTVDLIDFSLQIDHHFFYKIERHRDTYAYGADFYNFGDLDTDGNNELIFSFDAGYGLYPRGIFKMEFPSLKVTASPTEHMWLYAPQYIDFNNDNIPEILPACGAPCNSDNAQMYADTCSYLVALDFNLRPIFDPIKMHGNYSYVYSMPSFIEDSLFFTLQKSRSDAQNPVKIMLINSKGKVLKDREWNNLKNPENFDFNISILNHEPYLIIKNVGRFKLNASLSRMPDSEKLNKQVNSLINIPYCFDFNKDGTDELVIYDTHANLTILNEKANETLTFKSPIAIRGGITIYPYFENNETSQFAFTSLGGFFFLKYKKNPLYFTLFLIYLLTFFCTSGLIYAILFYQKRNIDKRWNTEKQLSELQFNAVKNQLNPHFLFNTLNSVAFMINEGRQNEAYDFLAINSRMIQRVMNDAKEVKRPLIDELQFTKDYLSIQKHRFKDRFSVEFVIHENVNQKLEVPKMCIHTYVENAIKHGFRNTKSGGLLKIEINEAYQGVLITISDNGMGRKASSEFKDSSGNGIKVMNEFYQLFEKYHGYKISFKIEDNQPEGTIIKLRIVIPHE